MAVVGDHLTAPEAGWKRYDNTNDGIKYTGDWSHISGVAERYNETLSFTSTLSDKFEFVFTGTKVRLIADLAANRSDNIEVWIDEVKIANFSQYDASTLPQRLVYEKTGLTDKKHKVSIVNNKTSSSSDSYLNIDAIDIESTGLLIQNKYLFQDGTDIKKYGNVGNAVFFDGVDDYVGFSSPIIPQGAQEIKFKVRRNGDAANSMFLMTNAPDQSSTSTGTYVFFQSDGRITYQHRDGSGSSSTFASSKTVFDGNWHEIKLTWDGTTNANGAKIYIDDMTTPDASQTVTFTLPNPASGNLQFARMGTSTTYLYEGDLDDVVISNGSDTAIAHYQFDEGSGTTINDSVGTNNGTLNGGAWVSGGSMEWIIIGAAPVTKAMFDTDGMNDLSIIGNTEIQALTSAIPELLVWTDEEGTVNTVSLASSSTSSTTNGVMMRSTVNKADYYYQIQSMKKG